MHLQDVLPLAELDLSRVLPSLIIEDIGKVTLHDVIAGLLKDALDVDENEVLDREGETDLGPADEDAPDPEVSDLLSESSSSESGMESESLKKGG